MVVLAAEVLPMLPGMAMVDVARSAGDPRDFVAIYRALSNAIAPLVSSNAMPDALPKPSGGNTGTIPSTVQTSLQQVQAANSAIVGPPF